MIREHLKGIFEFITVVEEGSFTAAAETLGTTRSRVSQVITALEQQVGVQLITRSTRSMHLTDVGERFYQQCRRGMTLIDQAIDQAQEDQKQLVGKIRINSVGGLFGEKILAPLIISFMQEHPGIDVELDFSSTQVDLIADHYDIAIRMGDLPDSTLIARLLCSYKSYVCASPEYEKKYGRVSHIKDFQHHNIISGSVRRWRFFRNIDNEQDDITIKGSLFCPNGNVARLAALSGLGIARLPGFYVEEDIKSGQLIEIMDNWHIPDSRVSIVYPQARYRIQRVQELIDYLLKKMST